jgi:hypothetical protein
MKSIHLVPASVLAMAMLLSGPAFASEPAPGSAESYSGSLAELATGVRTTPEQPAEIQSSRDVASGQAIGDGSVRGISAPISPKPANTVIFDKPGEGLTGSAVTNPGDGAGTPANVQGAPTSTQPDGLYNWPLEDIKVRNASNAQAEAPAGQETERRQHEPTVSLRDAPNNQPDGAVMGDGSVHFIKNGAATEIQQIDKSSPKLQEIRDGEGATQRTEGPDQSGATARNLKGTLIPVGGETDADAGPPKPTTPSVGLPGAVRKDQRRQRAKTRKPD